MAFDKSAAPQKNRKRRKVCQFCVDKAEYIDYKDTVKLRKYLSERSKILPRRTTAPAPTISVCSPRRSSVPVRSLSCLT